MKKKYIVPIEFEGKRLDSFISSRFEILSRKIVQQAIILENVTVNGELVKKNFLLKKGDVIEINEVIFDKYSKIIPNPGMEISVIFQNRNFIVVDKPGKVPTQPIRPGEKNTLLNAVAARFPDIKGIGEGGQMSGVVHRLDKDTSGLLVFARNDDTYNSLRHQFRKHSIKKIYQVLVEGNVAKKRTIVHEMAHHYRNKKKMIIIDSPSQSFRGKKYIAELEYRPVKHYGEYTLLEIQLKTGVMHQIRVQLAYIGHPVAGDVLYGSKNIEEKDKKTFSRHFVHAHKLGFNDPETGKKREFSSPLPDDLTHIIHEQNRIKAVINYI